MSIFEHPSIKKIYKFVPSSFRIFLKKLIYPPPKEIRLLRKVSQITRDRIKKEIIISNDGNVYHKNSLGFDFFVDINNNFHYHFAGEQEEFLTVVDLLKKVLPSNPVILDIGANIGIYSVSLAKLFLNSRVFAFEPVRSTYEILRKNTERNSLQDRIKTFKSAVGEKNDRVKITNNYDTGNFVLNQIGNNYTDSEITELITIDSFVNENNLEKIDFIKCDVEGFEKNVILGGMNSIKRFKPILLLEISENWTNRYEYEPSDIIELLKGIYSVYFINNSNKKIEEYKHSSDNLKETLKLSNNFIFADKGKEIL